MNPFTQLDGQVIPIDRPNIDTDAIIPKQYLKSIKRSGFGPNLFDDWRYLDPGDVLVDNSTRRPNPEFVLNQARYQNGEILLARENFGCGSSREHAVWALVDYGIRVVIAPSFADIFSGNTVNNGLLAITLASETIDQLFDEVTEATDYKLNVDLQQQTITTPSGQVITFSIEEYRRHRLLNGLDDIGMTLLHREEIEAYEMRRKQESPWLFATP